MRIFFCSVLFIVFFKSTGSAQITTTVNSDAQQLVEAIVGKGFIISNAKLTCPTGASGTFTSISSNIGLGKGIVLTTGSVESITGPSSQGASGMNQAPGDPLLGDSTQDACHLEFDLIPSCDVLKFKYVFASEEYPEYVGSINDAFAFFVSGPGIPTPVNIATLPNSNTTVNINNVNNITNSQYYVDNTNGQTVVYDGFTKALEATVKVIPCSKYHLVIVIADANDDMLDSGVFIEGNSLECTQPEIISPAVCANQDSIQLCAPPGYINYNWPAGQPGAIPPYDQQCITVKNPRAGDVYTVTMESKGGGCPVTSKLVLKGADFILTDTTICKGAAAFSLYLRPLTAGNYNYHWEPSTNLSCTDCQNPSFTPVSTQTYTVTMSDKDVSNCNRVRTVTITVDTGDTLKTNSAKICEGETATLTATGGNIYLWQPGALTGTEIKVQPTVTTTYTITSNSVNGCHSEATAVVTVTSKPVINVTDATICLKEKAVLKASGADTYQWITALSKDTGSTITVTPVVTTMYSVIGGKGGCDDTTEVTVKVNPLPEIKVTEPKACSGEKVTLTATGAASYSWLGINGSIVSTDSLLGITAGTTTSFTVVGTSQEGCKNSVIATVQVNPLPDVVASGGVVCLGKEFKLEAKGNAITYSWVASDSTKLPEKALVIVIPTSNTTYTVTGSIAYCRDTAVAQVNVNLPPLVTVNEGSICAGEKIMLKAVGATTYSWSTGATTDTITVSPKVSTTYLVTGVKNNCFQISQAKVTVNQNPDAQFLASPQELSDYSPTTTLINLSKGSQLHYTWSFGDGNIGGTSNEKEPQYTYSKPDTYSICLKITDSVTHCADSTCSNIIYKPDWSIYVPNAFTPNGNNLNEIFLAKGRNITEFQLLIFDRWGKKIFESNNMEKGWDGSIGTELAPEGTYVWKISCLDILKRYHQYIGSVTIIK